jgi:M6 family metalloprotease-like protein
VAFSAVILLSSSLALQTASARETAQAAAATAPRTTATDVSAATGRTIQGPITAWTTGTGTGAVEHVAGTTATGSLVTFYRSPNSGGWRAVDASAEAGRVAAAGTALTSWVTRDGPYTVEHVAAVGTGNRLLVFYWSPRNGAWRVVDATAESGRSVASGLTSWVTQSGTTTVEHVAGIGANGHLTVFWWSPTNGAWRAVDASAEAGRNVTAGSGLTSWISTDGPYTVEHVAAVGAGNTLLAFYWSPRNGAWRVVDATAESGRSVASGLTSWVTQSGTTTVEHVAGVAPNGGLAVFWWTPVNGAWRTVDATAISRGLNTTGAPSAMAGASPEMVVARSPGGGLLMHWWTSALDWQSVNLAATTGSVIAGDPVTWRMPTGTAPERIAVRGADNHLLVFESGGQERQLVDALRTPTAGLERMRNVRRDVLTILWDPHKPGITRPSRATMEATMHGSANSVRNYYVENSDGLYTIDNAGVLGWFDSDYAPAEYWPPDGSPGRDSGAEAIRKAAATFDFAKYDRDGDGDVDADELGIQFIIPGTGDGGGLNRIVGEDYTTRDTARGITVDGKKITWISEVSIGAPPGPGIVAHELAHLLLGLGDMYFTYFNPYRSSRYSLMDRDGQAPHLDPASKLKLGWLHPQPVLRSGRYQVREIERSHVPLALIDPRRGTKEYFILENRFPGTSYDRFLPDSGLAIWHVVEDPASYRIAPPGVSQQDWDRFSGWPRLGIRMIRPVRTDPLNDGRALWDGTDPDVSLRWADGTLSGFRVRDLSPAGQTMQVTIDVPAL